MKLRYGYQPPIPIDRLRREGTLTQTALKSLRWLMCYIALVTLDEALALEQAEFARIKGPRRTVLFRLASRIAFVQRSERYERAHQFPNRKRRG
jgi:hypothetical protein